MPQEHHPCLSASGRKGLVRPSPTAVTVCQFSDSTPLGVTAWS